MTTRKEKMGAWGEEIAKYLGMDFLCSTPPFEDEDENPDKNVRLVFGKRDGDNHETHIYRTDPTRITWVGNLVHAASATGTTLNMKVPA